MVNTYNIINMEKEDVYLPVEMGKLEIEPTKHSISINNKNPFVTSSLAQQQHSLPSREVTHKIKCSCPHLSKVHKNVSTRKKRNRVLKEPVLKLLQTRIKYVPDAEICNKTSSTVLNKEYKCNCSMSQNINLEILNFCALVDHCNHLRISSEKQIRPTVATDASTWWKRELPCMVHNVPADKTIASPSCSQQALNPPCDVTIDELASYFETLVHIPKKMSSMAEMMYI